MAVQDEALAERVRTAMIQDKRIGGQAIAVRVAQGEVSLKGVVDTEELRDLAIMVSRGISGVRHVNADELIVKEAAQ